MKIKSTRQIEAGDQFRIMLEKAPYPSGLFADRGENLRALTRDRSAYTPPTRPAVSQPRIQCIAVPTARDVRRNRKNIAHIMQVAQVHGAELLLFLCSGQAKKDDIAAIATQFPDLEWMAIEGPFSPNDLCEFQTTQSVIANDHRIDKSTKRNLALILARQQGWQYLFFVDDDVNIQAADLQKAAALLSDEKTNAVGFSFRHFPDQSVVVHAGQWVHAPIDSFIGSGSLAVKLTADTLPFFPHIYSEDWLFLLPYCLQNIDSLTWAGTIKQKRYDPFGSTDRAKKEEPGDLLAESLMRLVMTLRAKDAPTTDLYTLLEGVRIVADSRFWDQEIHTRAQFIQQVKGKIMERWRPTRKKRRILHSLDVSLALLLGGNGVRGLKGRDLARWVHAWLDDLKVWNNLLAGLPFNVTVYDTLRQLALPNAFLYSRRSSSIPGRRLSGHPADFISTGQFGSLPSIPRSERVLGGLQSTKMMQEIAGNQRPGIYAAFERAEKLRFDRPVDLPTALVAPRPELTICLLIAHHELPSTVSESLQSIGRWTSHCQAVQVILWVYEPLEPLEQVEQAIETYRDTLVARLLTELAGSHIYLRSEVLRYIDGDLDQLIHTALKGAAFAYWKQDIHLDHMVYIVNSHNELLRKGAFWDILQQQHVFANGPLEALLKGHRQIDMARSEPPLLASEDERALQKARHHFWALPRKTWRLSLWMRLPAITKLERHLNRAKLTWLEVDDMTYSVRVHSSKEGVAFCEIGSSAPLVEVKQVYIVPIQCQYMLKSELCLMAQDILKKLNTKKPQSGDECLVAICGDQSMPWQQLEQTRNELMEFLLEQCVNMPITFTSAVLYLDKAVLASKLRKTTQALALYYHWLIDYRHLPAIIQLRSRI